jgi:hypothetical protein
MIEKFFKMHKLLKVSIHQKGNIGLRTLVMVAQSLCLYYIKVLDIT